jgi:hypothetical protein
MYESSRETRENKQIDPGHGHTVCCNIQRRRRGTKCAQEIAQKKERPTDRQIRLHHKYDNAQREINQTDEHHRPKYRQKVRKTEAHGWNRYFKKTTVTLEGVADRLSNGQRFGDALKIGIALHQDPVGRVNSIGESKTGGNTCPLIRADSIDCHSSVDQKTGEWFIDPLKSADKAHGGDHQMEQD